MIALNAFKRYAQCDIMVNTEYFNCGPLLYISVVCPRGEALLLTSPVASDFSIRIIDDAVKQHKGQLVCGQNRNV